MLHFVSLLIAAQIGLLGASSVKKTLQTTLCRHQSDLLHILCGRRQ